jgi:hypothetical protein
MARAGCGTSSIIVRRKTMNGHQIKKIIVPLVLINLLVGCTVKLADHTPQEFPWQEARDRLNPDEVLYSVSTPQQIADLGENPAHRFILEVKPKNVSDIRAYITVNGVEHPMQGSGGGLWTYESTNECQASYSYNYRVRYKAGLYGQRTSTLGSATPFSTAVTNFGDAIWYEPGGAPTTNEGSVYFVAPGQPGSVGITEVTIVVQNLRNTAIVPYSIGFADLPGYPDNAQFEVINVPVLPVQLNCGDSIRFQVKWNPPSSTAISFGALRILANSIGGSDWSATVLLNGVPHPI